MVMTFYTGDVSIIAIFLLNPGIYYHTNSINCLCCLKVDEPLGLFGGRGHLVQCDESVFTRQKVCYDALVQSVA